MRPRGGGGWRKTPRRIGQRFHPPPPSVRLVCGRLTQRRACLCLLLLLLLIFPLCLCGSMGSRRSSHDRSSHDRFSRRSLSLQRVHERRKITLTLTLTLTPILTLTLLTKQNTNLNNLRASSSLLTFKHTKCRLAQVTSYNEFEAEDDEDSLREAVLGARFRWRAERSPVGAKRFALPQLKCPVCF